MKPISYRTCALALLPLAAAAFAQQSGDMKGMDMKPQPAATKPSAPAGATHETDAVVKSIDASGGKVTLSHGAIRSLNWPAMTMAFPVRDKAALGRVKIGQKVHVELKKEGSDYVVTSMK